MNCPSFLSVFKNIDHNAIITQSKNCNENELSNCIKKNQFNLTDLPYLISELNDTQLEHLAQRSHQLTKQRFGNTMQLFIPLYVSNACSNKCVYCGFSVDQDYKRIILKDEQIIQEAKLLKEKGFDHILLLTGESKQANATYIQHVVSLISPYFSSIGIEVQPLTTEEYRPIIQSGADSLTVYQETYHPESYKKFHVLGPKKDYNYRLETPERGAKAGFYRINLGALLGLYDWRYEVISLAYHLDYLQHYYWKTKYGISFPRIKKFSGCFDPPFQVSDKHYIQIITIMRLLFPDITITLSTREPKEFRDNLLKLGITTMSAESSTSPGGYSGKNELEQFKISDHRTINDIKDLLFKNNIEPVMKDWEPII